MAGLLGEEEVGSGGFGQRLDGLEGRGLGRTDLVVRKPAQIIEGLLGLGCRVNDRGLVGAQDAELSRGSGNAEERGVVLQSCGTFRHVLHIIL
jgi:hypothetical protein